MGIVVDLEDLREEYQIPLDEDLPADVAVGSGVAKRRRVCQRCKTEHSNETSRDEDEDERRGDERRRLPVRIVDRRRLAAPERPSGLRTKPCPSRTCAGTDPPA